MGVSDQEELFRCCKKGDLEKLRYLVEKKEVNLNVRDVWDSTPLYYACLCGHHELVKYLLSEGARCDASTFDGERCIYGCLNREIKATLEQFRVITSKVRRREPFQEFMRKLLEDVPGSDVTFVVHGEEFRSHKCILSARCKYYRDQFGGKWKSRDRIVINHALVESSAFYLVLEWIYTGQMKIPKDQIDEVQRICKQCKLSQLHSDIAEAWDRTKKFVRTKHGMKITQILVESERSLEQVSLDMKEIFHAAVPDSMKNENVSSAENDYDYFFDSVISAQGVDFKIHKALLSTRSEFFRGLIADHFYEASSANRIELNLNPDIFYTILSHVYTNHQTLNQENVYEVMVAGDMVLLPGLKRQCGNYLGFFIDLENVVSLIETARLFQLPKLERQCVEFMADNVSELCLLPEFHELVRRDAASIKSRQETDSIDIIDELRFTIRQNSNLQNEMIAVNKKEEVITNMLEQLGFYV